MQSLANSINFSHALSEDNLMQLAVYEQCFSLSACGARQITEEWGELNPNWHLEAFGCLCNQFKYFMFGKYKGFISKSMGFCMHVFSSFNIIRLSNKIKLEMETESNSKASQQKHVS